MFNSVNTVATYYIQGQFGKIVEKQYLSMLFVPNLSFCLIDKLILMDTFFEHNIGRTCINKKFPSHPLHCMIVRRFAVAREAKYIYGRSPFHSCRFNTLFLDISHNAATAVNTGTIDSEIFRDNEITIGFDFDIAMQIDNPLCRIGHIGFGRCING